MIKGLLSMSVFVFSIFFTNTFITEPDSDVMSNFGLLMIVLQGLGCISVAKTYQNIKWMALVCAIENQFIILLWSLVDAQ